MLFPLFVHYDEILFFTFQSILILILIYKEVLALDPALLGKLGHNLSLSNSVSQFVASTSSK